MMQRGKVNSLDVSRPDSPSASPGHLPCNTSVLLLVLHAGSVLGKNKISINFKIVYLSCFFLFILILDANVDVAAKKSDVTTFRGAFESVMRQHYPSLVGHIAIKLVSCPSICTESLGILSR